MMIDTKSFQDILPSLLYGEKATRVGWNRADSYLQLETLHGETSIYFHYRNLRKDIVITDWYTATSDIMKNDWYILKTGDSK